MMGNSFRGKIKDERPDLLDWLTNKADGDNTCGSNKIITIKCPDCGEERTNKICRILRPKKVACLNINCKLCDVARSGQYKYNIGDILNGVKVLYRTTSKQLDNTCTAGYCNVKSYLVECVKDHYKYKVTENHIFITGCPVCSNKKVLIGVNDIATTHPTLVKYFANKEDCTKYTYSSGKEVMLICPHCKTERIGKISDLHRKGLSCKKCGDGISYPEKIIFNIVNQLGISTISQLTRNIFHWCDKYRYDFYIPKLDCIVEVHGVQHYKQSGRGRSLKEEQKNDKAKREIALSNGIKHYIELDCRRSDLDWIKNSVMNSELPMLIGFKEEDIDWQECEEYSNHSNIMTVGNLFNGGMKIVEITNYLGISENTVIKYLKVCASLSICEYSPVNVSKKYVVCNSIVYPSINNFKSVNGCENKNVHKWMREPCKMPQKYIDLGLRYATQEEIDQYIASEEVNKVS